MKKNILAKLQNIHSRWFGALCCESTWHLFDRSGDDKLFLFRFVSYFWIVITDKAAPKNSRGCCRFVSKLRCAVNVN